MPICSSHPMHRLSLAVMAFSLGITLDGAPQALAQGAALEEVIVTARKRDENLMDIPESVSAIGALEVERRNIKGLNKIGLTVPNLNLSMRTDGYPNVTIRGLGAYGMTQGVGFYLDDVQLFSDASSRFGDIERIEVLKGPQGVLYGGSNIGGAVKYVSKAPSTEAFGGRLKVMAGEQGIWDIEGDINIPLSDKWALRAFAFTREDDGFMTNPGSLSPVFGVDSNQPEDVGAYEQSGGRLVLHGDITDRVSITASARYNEYDGPVNNWAREMGTPGNLQYPFTLDTNLNPTHERETFGARFEINVEFDNFDFKSITSYTDTESDRHTDVDLTQLWFFNTFRPETMEVFTQEFRFSSNSDGPLQWVGGFYLMDFEETMNSYLDFGWIILEADDPSIHVQVPFETRREEKGNLAAFGNVTYEVGAWEWGLGLRIDRWESDEEAVDIGHSASKDDVEVLPKISLTRHFNNDSMAYLTVSKGFEPGGWVGIADGAPPVYGPNGEKTLAGFEPEEAIQYELGWKGSLADGRVQATAALFFIDYDDRQFEFIIPNPSGDGTLIDGIENIGDSEQTGIELGLTWQASDYLQIAAAYGYIDAEWDSNTILPDGSANLGGQTPPQIIEHSTTVTANFQMPAFGDFDWIANLQLSHNGTMEGGKPSGGTVENPEFTVVDIQVGLTSNNWELMLNLDNAFDERYYTDLEPFPNFGFGGLIGTEPAEIIIGTHGHPRLFTASATYRF
jgi:iron complex outermembrane receptor protein